jgi:ABC-2 type transport system permease protein
VISLLRSELLRIRSRRMISILLTAGLVGILLVSVIIAVKSHKLNAADRAQAHAMYEQNLQMCISSAPPQAQSGVTPEQWCTQSGQLPSESDFLPTGFRLADLPNGLMGVSFVVMVMAMLVGASSMGAEWNAGSIATLLAWEPRRGRVMIARLVAVALAVAVMTVLLLAAMTLAFSLAAFLRGSTVGTGSSWRHLVLVQIGRNTLVAVVVSAIGVAIATAGRNTAAALGFLVGYLAIIENLLRGLRPWTTPWLLGSSAATYLSGRAGHVYLNNGPQVVSINGSMVVPTSVITISVMHALVVVITYAVVLVLVALVLFKRRDIT